MYADVLNPAHYHGPTLEILSPMPKAEEDQQKEMPDLTMMTVKSPEKMPSMEIYTLSLVNSSQKAAVQTGSVKDS